MKLVCSPVTPVKASLAKVNQVKTLRLLWSFRVLRAKVADPPALRVPGSGKTNRVNPSIEKPMPMPKSQHCLLFGHQDNSSTRTPFSVLLLWSVIVFSRTKLSEARRQNWNPQPCTTRHNDSTVVPSMTLAAEQGPQKVWWDQLFVGSLSASIPVTP